MFNDFNSLNFTTRFPKNYKEIQDAIELICRSFPLSYKNLMYKQISWKKSIPHDFRKKNFILAINNKNLVVGAFHVAKRILVIGGVRTPILATTDFCIDKSKVNDPNFGVIFFEKGLNLLKKLNYPIIMGSARKKLENFYFWYGFTSCNSYSRIEIEKLDYSVLKNNAEIRKNFNSKLSNLYEKLRLEIFSNEWNYFLRDKNFWNYINSFIKKKIYCFLEVYSKSKIIGFAIVKKKNQIIDFGIKKNNESLFFGTLFKYLLNNDKSKITFHISPENLVFTKLGLSHLCYYSRRIPDEGYVAKVLNPVSMVNLFCSVFSKNFLTNNEIIKSNIRFQTNSLKFDIDKNSELIPKFRIDKLTKFNEIELLNILFFGINNKFSIYKLKNFKPHKKKYFNILETESI
jgi:hypothetical protein